MIIPSTTVLPSTSKKEKHIEGLLLDTLALLTTTSVAVAGCSKEKEPNKLLENKSLKAYVDSMSDEELEYNLGRLNLLSTDIEPTQKYK